MLGQDTVMRWMGHYRPVYKLAQALKAESNWDYAVKAWKRPPVLSLAEHKTAYLKDYGKPSLFQQLTIGGSQAR